LTFPLNTPAPGRIGVLQPLPGIGDAVWHLPHVHAIATLAPSKSVTLITKPRSRANELLAGDPAVDRVAWLERNPGRHDGFAGLLRFAKLLRDLQLRRIVILHHSPRYALAARLAHIPERFGYGFGEQRRHLTGGPFLNQDRRTSSPIELATALLNAAGLPVLEAEPQLPVSAAARTIVRDMFAGRPRPWLALGMGSSEPYKQWGVERFGELAKALPGIGWPSIFLLGGPAEVGFGPHIEAAAGTEIGAVVNAINMPLDQVAALLAEADLYVGNDTGLLNVAAAVGTRALGLFGASPQLTHSRSIQPIEPEGGPASREDGMARIPVEKVLAALRRFDLGHARSDLYPDAFQTMLHR
jgi:heptosyltransferase-2